MPNKISYIGNILSKDGLKPDPKKTRAVVDMLCPESREDLQRFLGMLPYLGKFIPNLSHVTSPLRALLEKNVVAKRTTKEFHIVERIDNQSSCPQIF